jgi:hypothetical protein
VTERRKPTPTPSAGPPPADKPLDGLIEFPLPFKAKRGGSIRVPLDLTVEDCKLIELTIPVIRAYAEQAEADNTN